MTALEVIEKIFGYTGRYMSRVATFLFYFRIGTKRENYPACCAAQWAWDISFFRHRHPAVRRGTISKSNRGVDAYVPCWYHMRGPFWKPWGDNEPIDQLQLFKETRHEAQVRRRCEHKVEGRLFRRKM